MTVTGYILHCSVTLVLRLARLSIPGRLAEVSLGDPLHSHTNSVTSIACSPDSVHIASGSRDESVRLWNMGDILARDVMGPDSGTSGAHTLDDKAHGTPPTNQSGMISYSHLDAAAQYPPHLFPDHTFTIRDGDGSILGPEDELLLWVPPANRSDLLTPSSRSRISCPSYRARLQQFQTRDGMDALSRAIGTE